MERLISEKEIKKWLYRWIGYLDEDMIARMEKFTKYIPSVESKTGHWILHNEGFDESYVCSECDGDSPFDYNYCPYCGVKMD